MANNTWKNYTQKDTTLLDNDEVMLLDSTDEKNKRGLMSKFWNYVVDKMSTAVISKLETNNKTIIGAINALNSDSLSRKTENITQLPDGNKAKLISIGSTGIDVGSTGEKIPSWSFGIFLPSSGGSDACLLCANSTQITIAYKSSGVWVSCKRIG
ncbi:hypothetical protein [Ruminococcus sp. RTP21484sp1_RTP31003st1_F6_RTP31003_210430]|uniref:hypothetical protein n=1 Tax=Ruminococcus sp. RTP21484sp1_RTP31003st1_F6_RTP31003_210430 TaxID=3141610 RepID=UPI0034A2FAAF